MLKPGDHVDRYRIEEPIGEGGMGRVFRALDERLERRVALKVLHDGGEEEARSRLVREARAVAKLDHPNIVAVYDVGEHEAGPYVVMELVEGRSLRSVLSDDRVAPTERISLMTEVAKALAVAHDSGIVHRDVKPENVLVRKDGRVKVVDFGIARRTKVDVDPSSPTTGALSTLTADGVKVGTPTYMAPEQIKGAEVDGRVNQFAWGVTAYELFVGRPPWSGDAMALIAAILTEEPPPPPASAQMPHSFASVVKKALSKRPEDRFRTMHDLVKSIEAAALPSLMGAMPVPVLPAAPMPGSPYGGPQPVVYTAPPQYPPPMALSRRYNTAEVADIFDRALNAQKRRFRYDEISEAAREVGVDERTLREAMTELSNRGAVPFTDEQRAEDMMRVKRLLATWGVLSSLFFVINLVDDWTEPWSLIVAACIFVPFGLMMVPLLFRSPKRKAHFQTSDSAIEHDVARMTHYLRGKPVAPAPEPARVRVAPLPMPAAPLEPVKSETMRQAEAEVEALLAAPRTDAEKVRR